MAGPLPGALYGLSARAANGPGEGISECGPTATPVATRWHAKRFRASVDPCVALQEVEVADVEAGSPLERDPIEDRNVTPCYRYHSFGAKVLEDAVDMHDRKPDGIAQLDLRHGEPVAVVLRQPDRPVPNEQLAQDMGDALSGRAPAVVRHPLPDDRCIRQARTP